MPITITLNLNFDLAITLHTSNKSMIGALRGHSLITTGRGSTNFYEARKYIQNFPFPTTQSISAKKFYPSPPPSIQIVCNNPGKVV